MKQVYKSSRIPLYSQLIDIIIEEIESTMKENDQLLSEREICAKYDVSRATVRQAISEMEQDGYLYKVHGKGTFVSPKRLNQELLKFYSFTEEMKKIGKKPFSSVLEFEVISCNKKLSEKMHLNQGEEVYKFTRLRMADDVPMMVETSFVPYQRFPGIVKEDLERESMYDIFTQKFNAIFTMAEETFEPIVTSEKEAKLLNVSKQIPSLKIERYTYEKDKIIEYTVSVARGDKFKYHVKLEK